MMRTLDGATKAVVDDLQPPFYHESDYFVYVCRCFIIIIVDGVVF